MISLHIGVFYYSILIQDKTYTSGSEYIQILYILCALAYKTTGQTFSLNQRETAQNADEVHRLGRST